MRDLKRLAVRGEFKRFAGEELRAVLTRLASPGLVWELKFGSLVLLQPGRINAYAQAVMQTMRADEHGRLSQARRAKDNSPAFQRWVFG